MSKSSGEWTEVTVAGHPCDIFVPRKPSEHGYVVLYLHGVHLHRLKDKESFSDQFDRYGLYVIGPMTERSWWTDRICDQFDAKITAERHVLVNVLSYIAQRWGTKPPQIGLLGTSMGGQGALRFAYKYPETFPVVAAISPAIDYQILYHEGDSTIMQMYRDAESVRQDTATLHIHPLNWPRHQFFCCCPTDDRWWEGADRLRMKLNSLGIPHECELETEGGGHGFAYYSVMAERSVAFIAHCLERERLRIV